MTYTATDFYRAMTTRYRELARFTPDEASDIALRFHALAGELESFSTRVDAHLRQADPATAEGSALDALAAARGLKRREAAYARGTLQFTRAKEAPDPELPEGTVGLTDGGAAYQTTEPARFVTGADYCSVPARAARSGREGNAVLGTIRTMRVPIAGVESVFNPLPFTDGLEAEDDEGLRRRLLASYAAPNNGANAAFYRDAAESFPGISSAVVIRGVAPAEVIVYVAGDGLNSIPDELKEDLQQELNARRELCVYLSVADAEVVPVNLSVEIEPPPGVSFDDAKVGAEALLRGMIGRLVIGQRLVLAQVIRRVLEAGAASNCRILAPAADPTPGVHQMLRLGSLTLTGMGGGA